MPSTTNNTFKHRGASISGTVHAAKDRPTKAGKAVKTACKPAITLELCDPNTVVSCQRCIANGAGSPASPLPKKRAAVLPAALTMPVKPKKTVRAAVPPVRTRRGARKIEETAGKAYDTLIERLSEFGLMATVEHDMTGYQLRVALRDDLGVFVWHPKYEANRDGTWALGYGDYGNADLQYLAVPEDKATIEFVAGMVHALTGHLLIG